jgi:acetyl coenzyme A synthetase (ADP forming)-like protein
MKNAMSLSLLFSPTSIAVVGASTRPGTVGNDLLKNIVAPSSGTAFRGRVYPVNPKATELFGLRCYAGLGDIPDDIDLAVIAVPAAAVPSVLEEAGRKNVPAAVVVSAGFKEAGEAGRRLETQLRDICRRYGITLLGPNCLGFINSAQGLNASFAPLVPAPGNIAFVSQSGALCTAMLDLTHDSSLGFSVFASIGNKACTEENELLRHFAQDDSTKTIGFYCEDLSDASRLIETGRAILSRAGAKPVVALKAGLTQAGAGASASHTGSLGGSEAAYRALFRQARIVQARTLEEMVDFLTVFSSNGLPEGNRVAIVTNAGGPGVLATDAAVGAGLSLAKLSQDTEAALKDTLPPAAGTRNPVDVLGDARADRYRAALELVAADPNVDALLVILTPQTMTEIEATAQAVADVSRKAGKPVVAVFAGETLVAPGRKALERAKVAVLRYPEAGARALGALARVAEWRQEERSEAPEFDDTDYGKVRSILDQARAEGRDALLETEAWDVLEAYGFPLLRKSVAKSPEEALAAARSLGSPVALKIVSPDIVHKSDVGGVMLGVEPDRADAAYGELMERIAANVPQAKPEGVLVVEMARSGGTEIILGVKQEPGLGPLLMFGLGGIYVETFRDVSFRFAPATRADIREMMRETASFPLLQGVRGQRGVDLERLEECVARLSKLATDFPEVQEMDINPLLAFSSGRDFRVLDARIRIAASPETSRGTASSLDKR